MSQTEQTTTDTLITEVDPLTQSNQEEAEEKPLYMTEKEKADNKRAIRQWYKEQAENIKPQVELAELRARLSKAVYENYHFAAAVDAFEEKAAQVLSNVANNASTQTEEVKDAG